MKTAIRYLLAIVFGVLSVLIIQSLIAKLWNLIGIDWGPDNLPFELNQQIGMLSSAFIAGTIGPCLAVVIARKKALLLIIVFLIIGLSIDLYAAIVPLKPVATWFRVAWVISVPLQVYFGIELGGKIINKKSAH